MGRYLELLRVPTARTLIIAAFPARIAYGMISLSIFFKVQRETGSIALAGLAIGANSIAGAGTAGLRGAFIDKYGQKWPLRIMVPAFAISIFWFSTATNSKQLIIMAFLFGLFSPPINLSIRPLWRIALPEDQWRTAYALDTAVLSTTGIFGPVIATSLSLSSRPNSALQICALLMFIGGISIAFTKISREWVPEKKEIGTLPIWRVPAMQILALEGVVIGLGWGAFNIGIPAFTTQENLPSRAALLFAVFGLFNVFGGVIAGTVSRKLSPLKGFLITYKFWIISVAPLSLAYPDWSLILLAALIGLVGGVQQVFYWEVTEAVRPKGTAVSALAWLWTVEGTFAAIGSAIGGVIAENFGPRWCFAMTSVSVFIGYLILTAGKKHFVRANELPSDESDLNAMEENADKSR